MMRAHSRNLLKQYAEVTYGQCETLRRLVTALLIFLVWPGLDLDHLPAVLHQRLHDHLRADEGGAGRRQRGLRAPAGPRHHHRGHQPADPHAAPATGQQPGNYCCQRTFTKCARRRPLQAKYFLNLGNMFQYPPQYPAQYPGQGYQPAPQQPPPGYSQQAPYNPGY